MYRFIFGFALVCILATSAPGADLCVVSIHSHEEAAVLSSLNVDPLMRFHNDFILVADNTQAIVTSGLKFEILALGIDRSELAIDNSIDGRFADQFPVLYRRGRFAIVRARVSDQPFEVRSEGLMSLLTQDLRIEYLEDRPFNPRAITTGVDLDSLVGLVEADSLQSYTERLQAFFRREAGTDSCTASAEWAYSKFEEFEYDSVYYDTFTASIWGDYRLCTNVIAVKPGSECPEREIIVCGHRDAAEVSPGADDNGSGTAGTLEIARVLRNIPTDVTYKFITWDAEEAGLLGSFDYCRDAYPRGDSILYVMNMDMIGHYENTDSAWALYLGDSTYAHLWTEVADSLLGVTAYVEESGGSDHAPFAASGYRTTFASEYIHSTEYHQPSDSTTYLDFDYLALLTKVSLATAYAVMLDAMTPGVVFTYDAGQPTYLQPGESTDLSVTISTWGDGQIVPGSEKLHYKLNSGDYQIQDLIHLTGDDYSAVFPSTLCGDTVEYYFSADEELTGSYFDPDPSQPYRVFAATEYSIAFEDDFNTDKGWITQTAASSGAWERCVPSFFSGYPQGPAMDHDGSGYCYVTGCYSYQDDVDDGYVALMSPFISAATGESRVSYSTWFSNSWYDFDRQDSMVVYISSDGGLNWARVETIGPDEQSDGGWYSKEIWVSDYVTPSNVVRLKFTASDIGYDSPVEAAVDAIRVETFSCDYTPPPPCGDCDGSGDVDVDDAVYLITYIFAGGPAPDPAELGDVDCSGGIDIDDVVYLITYIFSSGPAPCAVC